MKKLLLFLLLFILNFQFTIAQISETDSLENLLQKYQKKDTIRVNLLNQTAYKLYLKDFEKTLIYATEANKLAEELNFLKGKSDSFRYIGIHYYMKANYSKALEFYQKSLKIEEELGNTLGVAKGCNNIGMVYRYQKNYPKSLQFLQKSLQKSREVGDKLVISFSLNNLGNTYRSMGDYSKSLDYYQKSLKIKEKLGSKLGIASSFHNIGKTYKFQNQYAKALDYLQKSLAISIEIKAKSIETRNYTELASVYLKQNKAKEALAYSKKAYGLATEIGELNYQKESLAVLSKSSEMLGLYKNAYKYHVDFKAFNDSIYNKENDKKFAGLEFKYEYDKEKQVIALAQAKKDAAQEAEAKKQEIVRNFLVLGIVLTILLVFIVVYGFLQKRKANTILAKQKEEIENTNEELNTTLSKLYTTQEQLIQSEKMASLGQLTAGVAHEINNPLNFIQTGSQILEGNLQDSSLLYQKYAKLKLIKQEEVSELIKEIIAFEEEIEYAEILEENQETIKTIQEGTNRIKKIIASLHDFSQLQQAKFNFFDIHKGLDATVALVSAQLNENIKIVKHYDKSLEDIECYPSQLNQVFLHLLNNANQAIEGAGEILISTKNKDKQVEISFNDTGSGIKKEILDKIFDPFFSTKDVGEGTGLGLSTAYGIIQKHKGSIEVKSEEGKGTEFIITLPKEVD